MKHPDHELNCLFIQPKFASFSFWNYIDTCQLIGAKTPSPPLGLLTVAALLPQHWNFKLMDLNTRAFSEEDWAWADLICVGGMLPQQSGILEIIKRAKREKKFVAAGGADPSSQPEIYRDADALVVGEGETSIPLWLESWRNGTAHGKFHSPQKPDVTKSPIPRFDLLNFNDYNQIGIQYSRGCPFNCEFCDIIELFGRIPRTKTPEQVVAEMEALYQLGYRGSVDLVDDNFIGNKRNVKKMLPVLIEWCEKRKFPFFFSTEASMNLADDKKLMELMQRADFRYLFMGIETPDPELLMMTQKSQNTMKPIVDRVNTIYEYGIVVSAGFIMGFDNEKSGVDLAMIRCIEDTGICMAMVGLLVALPNTQLTRRLEKEGRLLSLQGNLMGEGDGAVAEVDASVWEVVDQTVAGLNFVTTRDRVEILQEFRNVACEVYSPKGYMDRVLRTVKKLKMKQRHIPRRFWEIRRNLKGLRKMTIAMLRNPTTRWLYLRNVLKTCFWGLYRFDAAMRLMAIYLHFQKQTNYLLSSIERQIEMNQSRTLPFPRQVHKPFIATTEPATADLSHIG